MKRYLLAILLIANVAAARAQAPLYNSNESWARFSLQPEDLEPVTYSDTCLVFVSNRYIHPQSLRFVDEFLDTTSLKYFFLEKIDGKWNVYKENTLREAMEHLPQKKDIVVYAEGMGKIFTANVERAQLMSSQYNVNVIMFDYASTNTTYKPSKNFRFARNNAALSAGQYLLLLQELKDAKQRQEAWISGAKLTTFYHSMGNIILEQMVRHHNINGINETPFIDNLVINAACVSSKRHAEWVERIGFAKQVYVHFNRRDLQLKGAHLLTLRKQLGEKINKKRRAENAVYINFRGMAGWQHSYFMNFPYNEFKLTPAMVAYFSRLFNGQGISSNEATTLLATQKTVDTRM
ncbi:alpha/beta hydrolase [Chitinophaga sp. GCM10012297]|uniref:Alpha/beta hydrolase n=1 Tax=Chitinophaga chungangae TaxID=2821488 RepID=A0ABS3YER6_9BACT|nr:alpha/beta hydrolase [Chitinophaga chungangae]MBO9153176.1 alpha/beta hydrolase [Chitinophaga chungangae]